MELFAFPAQFAAIPEGPKQPQHFLLGQAFAFWPSCRNSQWLPGGTSPAPFWADPDQMDGAAHSLDPDGSNWAAGFLERPRRPSSLLVRGRPEGPSQREIERHLADGFEDGGGGHKPRNSGWKKTWEQILPKSPEREHSPASALPLADGTRFGLLNSLCSFVTAAMGD